MKSGASKRGAWSQSPPRNQMVSDVRALGAADRLKKLAIGHEKPGHVDDEVVVTLLLDAWHGGDSQGADFYATQVQRRVALQVKAHIRKNPMWARLGGGEGAVLDDFCSATVMALLADQNVPCHAEERFGQFVHRRCLDAAGKLYAKKHSAGTPLEEAEEGDFEEQGDSGDPRELSASFKTPEQLLMEIEEHLQEEATLQKVRSILEQHVPELPRIAFTYKYYAELKTDSKHEICITQLMGLTEKTVTKYINQAIQIIKQRLNDE